MPLHTYHECPFKLSFMIIKYIYSLFFNLKENMLKLGTGSDKLFENENG